MKNLILWPLMLVAMNSFSQQAPKQKQPSPTLKSILLMELRETHNQKNWFVSAKEAGAELTPEQAAWSDGKNHSVGQLVAHLVFWNSVNLAAFKGEHPKQPADNNDTFRFDPAQWDATLKQFDNVMTELERIVGNADDATLAKIAPSVARIAEHNAYHIGEIIAVRKEHGMWNPDLGVK
jgi:DinB superfamily